MVGALAAIPVRVLVAEVVVLDVAEGADVEVGAEVVVPPEVS